MTKYISALCVGICCLVATQTAFALLAPIGSLKKFSTSWTYPESARQQLQSALEVDNSKFIKGNWCNGRIQLEFAGDTDAVNEMVKRLANCPGVSLTVSFQNSDQSCDWKVDFAARDIQIQVVVNLKSRNIALDRLAIPATKGPELEPSSTPSRARE